jgi:hypothetical protein
MNPLVLVSVFCVVALVVLVVSISVAASRSDPENRE